jgi:membrane protease YdiL (CAAX protease family)
MAVVATRLPARLLAVDKKPKLLTVLLAFATLVCATPAMNASIEWNANWHLPEAFSGFEALMRQMEDAAQTVTDQLMAKSTVPSLIVSILIVGVLAGFSEELFFRGAMQRLFGEMGMNKHVAVWSVALIFSVMHFQFFGFVPRMLLGVFNSIVVFTTWREVNELEAGENFNTIGSDLTNTGDVMLVIGSVIVTVVLLYALYKTNRQNLES